MRRTFLKLFIATTVLSISHSVMAEGFQVNLQDTRSIGMGHAGTGFFNGPSSIHFNPGALGMLDSKFSMTIGGSLIFGSNLYQSATSTYNAKTENPVGTPFYAYFAGQVMPKLVVGLGINTPFGNSLKWEENWSGRYLIEDIAMQSITILPTVSYKINDMFSIGAGMLIGFNSVELSKAIPLSNALGDGRISMSGKTTSFGFNVGLYAKFNEKLSAGISYRSKSTVKLDGGDVDLTYPVSLASLFPASTTFKGELPFPSNINLGIALRPIDKLMIAVDVHYVGWSAYDSLNFDFSTNSAALQDSYNPRKYEDSWIFRIGFEYQAIKKMTVRAGFYFDQTPIQDDYFSPETPGANKLGFTGGLSFSLVENLKVDLALIYIYGMEREAYYTPDNFGGKYSTVAMVPSIGISYKF
ncbi:MAG: outer membrane protein transport protein [Salinivirgaceae bacterium]|nr:outer membrane protein transport protein [Salinivirgaceae bacterium]